MNGVELKEKTSEKDLYPNDTFDIKLLQTLYTTFVRSLI